ncbi:hypothetical protein [Rhodobacter sp. JA431]|uniref:hypothetical protein n=1 Tax=Rhodobacter sp. JA431 TaxID=570013 RepID=UPI001BAF19E6|nr:hypothetical protein [Rhodobacter sp. JA431]
MSVMAASGAGDSLFARLLFNEADTRNNVSLSIRCGAAKFETAKFFKVIGCNQLTDHVAV